MEPEAPQDRPLSQVSIAALVCAIGGVAVPCCPLFPMLAIVLGLVARSRIRRGAAVRGGRMAVAAMVLGGVGLVGQGVAFDWLAGRFQTEVQTRSLQRIEELMRAAAAADVAGTLEVWPRVHGGRPDEVIAFADAAESRYGPFESVSVSTWTYGGEFGEPDVRAAALWRFRDRDLIGVFRMRLVPGTSLANPYPSPVPMELLISDEGPEGDLSVGEIESGDAPEAESGPAADARPGPGSDS